MNYWSDVIISWFHKGQKILPGVTGSRYQIDTTSPPGAGDSQSKLYITPVTVRDTGS